MMNVLCYEIFPRAVIDNLATLSVIRRTCKAVNDIAKTAGFWKKYIEAKQPTWIAERVALVRTKKMKTFVRDNYVAVPPVLLACGGMEAVIKSKTIRRSAWPSSQPMYGTVVEGRTIMEGLITVGTQRLARTAKREAGQVVRVDRTRPYVQYCGMSDVPRMIQKRALQASTIDLIVYGNGTTFSGTIGRRKWVASGTFKFKDGRSVEVCTSSKVTIRNEVIIGLVYALPPFYKLKLQPMMDLDAMQQEAKKIVPTFIDLVKVD